MEASRPPSPRGGKGLLRRLPIEVARFRPRLLDSLAGYDRTRFARDLGAGLTVGVVALPLAMAFAIASGVKPEQGLITAIVAGFLISALGGSQVQIGGPAGAFIVVVYAIVERYGLTNLLISTAMAGVLLFLMGLFKLGALVRFIPVAIVIGFTNGIAVLIGLSQVKDLLGLSIDKLPADFFSQIAALGRALPTLNPVAVGVGLASLAIVVLWPKSYRMPVPVAGQPVPWSARALRVASMVPGTVIALGLATLATALLSLPIETIGSRFGGIPQSLPDLDLPVFSWESAKQLVAPTITIALLGAIESLLCARVADNMCASVATSQGSAPPPRHDPNQELMAQGVANMAVPMFGGIPATGTIARTVTNIRSGAASPVSGIVHALTLLAIVLVAAPLAVNVPLAGLAGILMFVAWNMGEWREFAKLKHFRLPYRTVLLGTFFLTVVFDLTVAVEVGLTLACLFFIVRMGSLFRVERLARVTPPEGVEVYELYGALFFGAVDKVEALETQIAPGTRTVVLELHRLISMDSSGLEALENLHAALQRRGAGLVLADANAQPLSLMRRSGFLDKLGRDRVVRTLDEALDPGRIDPQELPQR
jgi:sulfate permease, SulP family